MAIVIAIIGLIAGAIMGGQSMIRSSRVNSIGTDVARYQAAVKTFKDSYTGLPGDMVNATTPWGIAAGTGSDNACFVFDSTGATATCNGDGDNSIDAWNETFRFWQHLTNAQMIEGNFTGTKGSANFDHDVGANCPASKVSGTGIGVTYSAASIASATQFAVIPNNYFVVGAETAGAMLTTGSLSPAEIEGLDNKMDDSLPGRGNLIAGPWDNCTSAANNADLDATYVLTSSKPECWFYYVDAF